MDAINWGLIEFFTPGEFSEDPNLYAEPQLIMNLDEYRRQLGRRVHPSPVKGALARLDGSTTTEHYAVGRKSTAVDIFPEGSILEAWTLALVSGLWGGIGVYFDTKYAYKPHCMLHLDLRKKHLIWYRLNKKDMDWEKLVGTITKVAPMLGTIVGGPAGGAVGTAVKLIANGLGVEETPDAIEAEIRANPSALLKLKKIEADNKVELRKLVLEQERVRLADVSSARSREVEVTKATGKRDVNLYALGWTVVVGFFGLIALLCFKALPEDSNGVVFMLFGSLATGFGQVLSYFFGSSKSSSEKTKLLAKK